MQVEFTPRAARRFWSKVEKTPHCWLWVGGRQSHGYGMFHLTPQSHVLAHRVSFAVAHGPIPEGMHVLHRCDNPACVNSAHLFLGTHQDNMADMTSKGRRRPQSAINPACFVRGEQNASSKLDSVKVREIRRLIASGVKVAEIAPIFRISGRLVRNIRNGDIWRHVQ